MYLRKRFHFRDSIEVEENHNGRYGAPGQRREKRKKPTKEQIALQNQRNKEKNIRRLIKWNFMENDYWVTLTYRKDARPPDMEAAKEDIQKLLRNLRPVYKKAGEELKYIVTTEIGSKGGIHHHVILNRLPELDIHLRKRWNKGGANMALLYDQGGYADLAEYIAKQPSEKGDKWYSRSRNFYVEEPKKRLIRQPTFKRLPEPTKGYYLDKNTIVEGINPVTGYKYRHYTYVKIKDERQRAKGKHARYPRYKDKECGQVHS